MKQKSKGDLVYVPSEVTLFTKDSQGSVNKIMKLAQPANVLVVDVIKDSYKVLYENEEWYVNKSKTYEV